MSKFSHDAADDARTMTIPLDIFFENSRANKKNLYLKKNNRRRLNGSVFCNMSLGEELTITSINMSQVSLVGWLFWV